MARWHIRKNFIDEETTMQCSECKTEFLLFGQEFDLSIWPGCPKCGVEMEEVKHESINSKSDV